MKLKQKNKMSLIMACAMIFSVIPNSTIASAATDENIIYDNNNEINNIVSSPKDQVIFKVKNCSGEIIDTITGIANNDIYQGNITKELLDKIGKRLGSIELYFGDEYKGEIKALFNLPEVIEGTEVVDDFEGYGDDDLLLQNTWKTNAGDGCTVSPKLVKDGTGNHDLEFNYKISTEKVPEGWAGITKDKQVDWSKYNSLQFWCTPDGKGQKLVIQITSNGEDFEVFMPEFSSTTEEELITLPFSEFKGKNGGTLDLSKIERIGIWCNTISENSNEIWTVDSKMYFDDIKAVYAVSDTEKAKLIKRHVK